MAKIIMIQGTMSSVGKTIITAGLCRIFRQDGYRVAPFKSQNMSSNAFTVGEGLLMSKSQAIQAEAAGTEPSVLMNPVLLKPLTDMGSEVFVHGLSRGKMQAAEYYKFKETLMPEILSAFENLSKNNDIIVVEGAGSPAEINLKKGDIVNMGLANALDAPVLLVGDIDCGGVFAQIVGTLVLLEPSEQARVKGIIINKFRGDLEIFRPAISMLEERTGKTIIGVVPYLDLDIEEEDSLVRHNGVKREPNSEASFDDRQVQYDILADGLRKHLDMAFIYKILEGQV